MRTPLSLSAILLFLACASDDELGEPVGSGSTGAATSPDATTSASSSDSDIDTSTTASASDSAPDPTTSPIEPDTDDGPGNTSPCSSSLVVEPEVLPAGTVGEPYRESLTISAPTGWELQVFSELPEGVEVQSTGSSVVVSGTPSAAGSFSVQLSLGNDDGGQCGQQVEVPWEVEPADGGSSTSSG